MGEIFPAAVFYFAAYSFLGWFCETAFCSFLAKKFVNRGFLTGPFCPIYAVGAFAVLLTLNRLKGNILLVFICGVIVATAIEYFTGLLLEWLFDAKWWDYSDVPLNFQGRICLFNSLCFGVMAVLVLYVLHPAMRRLYAMIPPAPMRWFSRIFVFMFALDLILTVFSVLRLNKRLEKINAVVLALREKLDAYGYMITSGILERVERLMEAAGSEDVNILYRSVESLISRIRSIELDNRISEMRLLRAFPNMRSKKYPEYLDYIRKQLFGKRKG